MGFREKSYRRKGFSMPRRKSGIIMNYFAKFFREIVIRNICEIWNAKLLKAILHFWACFWVFRKIKFAILALKAKKMLRIASERKHYGFNTSPFPALQEKKKFNTLTLSQQILEKLHATLWQSQKFWRNIKRIATIAKIESF